MDGSPSSPRVEPFRCLHPHTGVGRGHHAAGALARGIDNGPPYSLAAPVRPSAQIRQRQYQRKRADQRT